MRKFLGKLGIVFLLLMLSAPGVFAEVEATDGEVLAAPAETQIIQEKGEVIEIETILREVSEDGEITVGGIIEGMYEEQTLKIELLSGKNEGEIVKVKNNLYGNPFDLEVEEGDKVFLYAELAPDGSVGDYSIQDLWHSDGLIVWSIVFLVLVVVLGGFAGLRAILSLAGSVALIFFVLLPLIKNGWSPVPVTIGISAAITVLVLLVIAGFSRKSWVAMGGTFGGVLAAVLFVYLIGWFSNLTGLGTEDSRILAVNYPDFNFQGILFCGIILGALGAVMDVAISISSGLAEVKTHKPRISRKELIKSGMNIGKDIIGSMLNTLIFAYIGVAMVSIVLFSLLKTDLMELLNYGFIAEEIARSLVGSLGLLATIPLTAGLAGVIMGRK